MAKTSSDLYLVNETQHSALLKRKPCEKLVKCCGLRLGGSQTQTPDHVMEGRVAAFTGMFQLNANDTLREKGTTSNLAHSSSWTAF
ncbi:hypothetical protein GJ744_003786 [Endocarpon pusillum]|uniref:Uncharacterized protein n=1 Tax=Endocarpon pusillum TaxID=364733 RepID=A0A8H7AM68_9EURO|nr:hypothetical protein GJ744_003786 [Endocarpon pusillum]